LDKSLRVTVLVNLINRSVVILPPNQLPISWLLPFSYRERHFFLIRSVYLVIKKQTNDCKNLNYNHLLIFYIYLLISLKTNCSAMLNNSIFLDDNNSITNGIFRKVTVFKLLSSLNSYIITNPAVLVQNSIFYITTFTYSYRRWFLGRGQ